MYHKTDRPEYMRDSETGALISVDHPGLLEYKKKREQIASMSSMKNDVEMLKEDVNGLKSILQQILEKVSK